jgi:IS4 transposase
MGRKRRIIHIFDRGYNDYSQFQWIEEKQAYFVTRALGNIKYSIIQNRRVGHRQKEKGIIADRIIEVITDRKQNIKYSMRMVTFRFTDSVGKEQMFSLLTNLLNFRSDEIAELYRKRWNIEVVFRWIKMFLKIERWLSRSKNGVLIQIYTALCAYIIVLTAKMNELKKYRIMKDVIYDFIIRLKVSICMFERGSNIEDLFLESS